MIIVGCGKAKLAHAAPARDLYTGSLFRAARRYVEARGERWFILSAAHGLIAPEVVVRPYDQVLDLRGEALVTWARKAACQVERMRDEAQGTDPVRPRPLITILAGVRYAAPLAEQLGALGFDTHQPLWRLEVGQRLSWFKREIERLATWSSVEARV